MFNKSEYNPSRVYLIMVLMACLFLTGCVSRTITIVSQPSGAIVWLNDREVGRTPITKEFTYYGEYDVRAELTNHKPIMTTKTFRPPVWDAPPLDLIPNVFSSNSNVNLKLELVFKPNDVDNVSLVERAKKIRN